MREGRRLGRREWGGGKEERREDRGERKRILCNKEKHQLDLAQTESILKMT